MLNMLNINSTFRNLFKATPVTAFRKNALLKQIIVTNKVRDNQKRMKVK